MEARINLNRAIDAIVAEAEKMAPSTAGMTKAERLEDIRENRKEEKEAIRADEAFTAQPAVQTEKEGANPAPVEEKAEDSELTPIQRLLRDDLDQRRRKGNGGKGKG